jgi:hypothetical protein
MLNAVTIAEGATQTVTLTATDPENDTLTFSLVSPPAFASLMGATLTLTPNYTQSGSYTINVRVTDGTTPVDGSFSVTVTNTNRAPVLLPIADVAMIAGTTPRTVMVDASDPDGDMVTLSAMGLPSYATLMASLITIAPSVSVVQTVTVTVTATDGTLSTSDSFDIVVTAPPNQAPTLTNLAQVDGMGATVAAGATVGVAPSVRVTDRKSVV